MDVKKKQFDELDTLDLGELTELVIKKLSALLSPYLRNNDSTPPAKKASDNGTTLQEPGMTVRKNNYMYGGLVNARRIRDIQRSIFTPTKSLRYLGIVTESTPSSIANSSQSKVLTINNSYNVDAEVMKSKRKLIDKGPPILINEHTFSAFSDWRIELLEFLQRLLGYQIRMSSIPPDQDSEVIMSKGRLIDNGSPSPKLITNQQSNINWLILNE